MKSPVDESGVFLVAVGCLQPSQLYISAEKLVRVREAVASCSAASPAPLPVVRLDADVVLTDGHTRAYAAWSPVLIPTKSSGSTAAPPCTAC